jgi:hypothetical protein
LPCGRRAKAVAVHGYIIAAITAGLRRRGVDKVTAQEDGGIRLEDAALLDRLGLVNGAGTLKYGEREAA